MSEKPGKISRRAVVASISSGIIGLILGGIVGSQAFPREVRTTETKTEITTITKATTLTQVSTVTTPVALEPTFLIPPPPIPDEQITQTLEYDVVIVGAGTSGLAAAVAAAEEGVKVVLLEREPTFSARGGDNTALNSKIHRQLGIYIDPEEIIKKLMEISGYRADERIIRLWAYNSGKVMDWLIDMCEKQGVKSWLVIPDRADKYAFIIDRWPPTHAPPGWDYRKQTYIEYPTCHRFGDTPAANQALLLSILELKARDLGVEIRYETNALRLERPDNGRVKAVIAQTKDGKYIRFKAKKSVILSTGDYGGNRAMVEYFLPEEFAKLPDLRSIFGMPAPTGDGHLMAYWIGAQIEPRPHCAMVHAWHAMGTAPFLMVDKFGKRFANEDLISNVLAFPIQCLRNGGIWVVFDSNWPKYTYNLGPGFFRIWKADVTTLKEFQQKIERGQIIEANTIDELAHKMKGVTPELDVVVFKKTVERYNELCRKGIDEDFGKRSEYLFPVDTKPFYANWNPPQAAFLVTMGGLITNENLQPVDKDGKVIPGLYVTGNLVGRRFGLDYPLICPGLSHSMAWTTGYIAGKNAAREEITKT